MSNGRHVKIGMIQLLVEGGEPERNLDRARKYVAQAARENCSICLLPECLDLAWTHPSSKVKSKPIPGEYSDVLCRTAVENKIFICAGLTERDGEKIYNSAILISDQGKIELKYRKINVLVPAQEYYSIGNSLSVVETPFGLIGVNICSDNYDDALEIGSTLARMGAEIILSPCSWTSDYNINENEEPYGEKWVEPYKTLASLFDLVIIGTTSVGYIVGGPYEGKKMIGQSLAVCKNGVISEGTFNEFASELVVVELEIPQERKLGTAVGKMLRMKNKMS